MRFAKTTSISGKLEILICINYSFHSSIFLKVVLTKVAYFHRIFGILINLDNTGVMIGQKPTGYCASDLRNLLLLTIVL